MTNAPEISHGGPGGTVLKDEKQYEIIACMSIVCRVNTFERGERDICPGCGEEGRAL